MLSFNKIIIYMTLIIIYLGLSKALSPAGLNVKYVFNNNSLSEITNDKPVSVVLIDTHSTGFAIKTHYHKYRVVYGFRSYQEMIVKVSSAFKEKHEKHIGASIFRKDQNGKKSFEILIPGSIFIGDQVFGRWVTKKDDTRIWKFSRVYRHLSDFLGWDSYIPNYSDYQQIQLALNQNSNYFGRNKEFGTNGSISKKSFSNYYKRLRPSKINFKSFLKEYFKENFYKSKVTI